MAKVLSYPEKKQGLRLVTELWNKAFKSVKSAQVTEKEMAEFIKNGGK